MDVPRKSNVIKRRIRRIAYIILLVVGVGGITIAVSRLKPAAQTIDRQTVWIDTVKRGSMLRQVRGLGTLVPEEIRWIPAQTQGRVERRLVKPGETVRADTVIIELSNPEVERDVLDAESQLRAAEAEYKSLQVRLESQLLDQKAAAATVRADYNTAKFQAEVNEELSKEGLVPENNVKLSKIRAEELEVRNEIEQQRLKISAESVKAQLEVQRARVEQLKALYDLRRSQLESLKVRAGIPGVLQEMNVEVGQQVAPGTNLARVSNPNRLKAELRIAETQAKDIQIGQPVSVDTRNGIIPGRVSRIDPAAQNGTVTVDAELLGELPKGARPDLSVDGTIELERLENVLYVGRPVHGQENSMVGLFKLEDGGKSAVLVQVRLGRSSVNTIEILDGLKEGDQVILSDTSAWDKADRINLN
ncbi:MAG TPA: HlyD family efflux transporter periplasmic adaptor subunit [Blastocatellia bacterium]|nr:HlyD family efflux transporter periplasmic adaptor subunit [Blastocatellia bacterium]